VVQYVVDNVLLVGMLESVQELDRVVDCCSLTAAAAADKLKQLLVPRVHVLPASHLLTASQNSCS